MYKKIDDENKRILVYADSWTGEIKGAELFDAISKVFSSSVASAGKKQ